MSPSLSSCVVTVLAADSTALRAAVSWASRVVLPVSSTFSAAVCAWLIAVLTPVTIVGIAFCAVVGADARVTLNEEHLEFRWVAMERIEAELMWSGQRVACGEVIREIIGNGASKAYCRIAISRKR